MNDVNAVKFSKILKGLLEGVEIESADIIDIIIVISSDIDVEKKYKLIDMLIKLNSDIEKLRNEAKSCIKEANELLR